MKSPKGTARLAKTITLGIMIILSAFLLDPQQAQGWLMTTFMSIGKAFFAGGSFYWLLRAFLHHRTHQLGLADRVKRENALVIGTAIVFGLALVP